MNFTRESYGWWFIESLEGAHELTFKQIKSHIFLGFVPAPRPDRHASFFAFRPLFGGVVEGTARRVEDTKQTDLNVLR